MNEKEAVSFDVLEAQITSSYEEIGILSKKKPDAPINKFKIKLINELLEKVNKLLGDEFPPFSDFRQFDEEDLPSASDIVFVLSQYLDSMVRMRYEYTENSGGTYYWILDNGANGPKTRRSKWRI